MPNRKRHNRYDPDGDWLAEAGDAARNAGAFIRTPARWPRISALPANLGALALVLGVIVYGLFAGGHVSLPAADLARPAAQLAASAGLVIDQITITGRRKADPVRVMTALGAERGGAILYFDTSAARERLERLGWVASARVTRLLPNRIDVEIVERAPYALWQRHGRVAVIDRTGRRLPGLKIADHLKLPLVVGTGAGERTELLMAELDARQGIAERLRAAVLVARRRWTLKFDGGLDILLPEGDIGPALDHLARLDADYQVLSRDLVAVDLRLPDRVVFRRAGDAAEGDGAAREQAAVGKDKPGG